MFQQSLKLKTDETTSCERIVQRKLKSKGLSVDELDIYLGAPVSFFDTRPLKFGRRFHVPKSISGYIGDIGESTGAIVCSSDGFLFIFHVMNFAECTDWRLTFRHNNKTIFVEPFDQFIELFNKGYVDGR